MSSSEIPRNNKFHNHVWNFTHLSKILYATDDPRGYFRVHHTENFPDIVAKNEALAEHGVTEFI